MKFVLKCGKHRGKDRQYNKGDIIESDRDLVVVYGEHRFKLVDSGPVKTRPEIPVVDRSSPSNTVEGVPEQAPSTDASEDVVMHPKFGEDVTETFKKAGKLGVNVYLKGKIYHVVDPETDSELTDEKTPPKMKKKFEVIQLLNRLSPSKKTVENEE